MRQASFCIIQYYEWIVKFPATRLLKVRESWNNEDLEKSTNGNTSITFESLMSFLGPKIMNVSGGYGFYIYICEGLWLLFISLHIYFIISDPFIFISHLHAPSPIFGYKKIYIISHIYSFI